MKNTNVLKYFFTVGCSLLIGFSAQANNATTESPAAAETKAKLGDVVEIEQRPGVSFNALIGVGAFEKTGDQSQDSNDQNMAGSLTFDIGDKGRVIETGLSYFQTSTKNSTLEINSGYLAIPLNAKFYTSGTQKGLYIKGGMLTSFLVSTNNKQATRNLDIIGNLGVGGKFPVQKGYEFIIEGTYNRGFLDQLRGTGDTFNQGLLIIGGLAFSI